jgi:hypothetical protein
MPLVTRGTHIFKLTILEKCKLNTASHIVTLNTQSIALVFINKYICIIDYIRMRMKKILKHYVNVPQCDFKSFTRFNVQDIYKSY